MYDYIFVAIKDIWYILLFDSQNLALWKISSNLNISGPQLRKTFSRNINAYVFMIFNLGVADFYEKSRIKSHITHWNIEIAPTSKKLINAKIEFHIFTKVKNSRALFSQTYIWKALAYMTVMIIKFYVRNI